VNTAAELKGCQPATAGNGLLRMAIWNMALRDGILGSRAPTEAAGINFGDGLDDGDQGKTGHVKTWREGRPKRPKNGDG